MSIDDTLDAVANCLTKMRDLRSQMVPNDPDAPRLDQKIAAAEQYQTTLALEATRLAFANLTNQNVIGTLTNLTTQLKQETQYLDHLSTDLNDIATAVQIIAGIVQTILPFIA